MQQSIASNRQMHTLLKKNRKMHTNRAKLLRAGSSPDLEDKGAFVEQSRHKHNNVAQTWELTQ